MVAFRSRLDKHDTTTSLKACKPDSLYLKLVVQGPYPTASTAQIPTARPNTLAPLFAPCTCSMSLTLQVPRRLNENSVLWETSSSESGCDTARDNIEDDDEESGDDTLLYEARRPAPKLEWTDLTSDDHDSSRVHTVQLPDPDRLVDLPTSDIVSHPQHGVVALSRQQIEESIKRALDLVDRKCNRYICYCALFLLLVGCIVGLALYFSK